MTTIIEATTRVTEHCDLLYSLPTEVAWVCRRDLEMQYGMIQDHTLSWLEREALEGSEQSNRVRCHVGG
jgi:hypothetical protein